MRVRYAVIAGVAAILLGLAAFAGAGRPVADAAMKRDRSAVRTLIEQKADVNAPQADGATALQWASYNNDPETADILLAAGANVKGRQPQKGQPRFTWLRSKAARADDR